jgi:hypothetical protein
MRMKTEDLLARLLNLPARVLRSVACKSFRYDDIAVLLLVGGGRIANIKRSRTGSFRYAYHRR